MALVQPVSHHRNSAGFPTCYFFIPRAFLLSRHPSPHPMRIVFTLRFDHPIVKLAVPSLFNRRFLAMNPPACLRGRRVILELT